MRKTIVLLSTAVALLLPAALPAVANEPIGNILFGRPSDPGVSVIYLRNNRTDKDRIPMTYRYPSQQTLARAQDEIASNPAIRDSLEKRNIRLRNVLGVQTALNGNKIVYVK